MAEDRDRGGYSDQNPYRNVPQYQSGPPDIRNSGDGGGGDDGDGGNPLMGLIILVLVGGGIFLLWKTTGILIIPIPRR
jgi:hypothetical protein